MNRKGMCAALEKWRLEITALMDKAGCLRPPALRRSLRNDALFSTDLPQAADEESVSRFIHDARLAGWRTEKSNGWIHLDRDAMFDAAEKFPTFGPEALCCLSLLKRHAKDTAPSDGMTERSLLKASEEGYAAFECLCGKLHAQWAAQLRSHINLPDIDRRFFGGESAL